MNQRLASFFRRAPLAAGALFLSLALGCGGSSSPSPQDGGSSSQTCTEQHACVNSACKCSEGPKKDQSCCNPDDSSCSNSSTRCDEFCKVCS
jgi:hypothetical protein